MADSIAQQFMTALQQIEKSKNPEALVALFADDAELSNLSAKEPSRGVDGAREFWQRYLSDFESIASTFHNVVEGANGAAMEWTSEGTLAATGQKVSYKGVSVIETAGGESAEAGESADGGVEIGNGRVSRFRTYYDTAAFLPAVDAEEDSSTAKA